MGRERPAAMPARRPMAAGSVIVARVGRGMMLKAPVRFQILVAAAIATEMQLPARRPMPACVMMRVAHSRRAAARETRRVVGMGVGVRVVMEVLLASVRGCRLIGGVRRGYEG
jgi:hypothetical protein